MTISRPVTGLSLALALATVLQSPLSPAAARTLERFDGARLLRVFSLLEGGRSPSQLAPAAKAAGAAADDGAIAGTVRNLDPEGLAAAMVMAWSADSLFSSDGQPADTPHIAVRSEVARDGTYRLEGLPAGPYYVSATAKGYGTQYYRGAADLTGATVVEVPDGGTVEGIDFALEQLGAGEGSITGLVTAAADGEPVAGAVVHAFVPDSPYQYGAAETDAAGHYTIDGLQSGRYVVEVWSEEYLPQFYGGAAAYDEAVPVEVTEPDRTSGIDFALERGGSITGMVRRSGGEPVAGAYVSASRPIDAAIWDDVGTWEGDEEDRRVPGGAESGWAVTDADGFYRVAGLTTGEYRVEAQSGSRWVYASAWYDGAASYEEATPVAVIAGQETAGIDLVLDLPVLDASIAGRVTSPDGAPVDKAWVTVQAAVDWAGLDSVMTDGDVVGAGSPPPPEGAASGGAIDEVGAPVVTTVAADGVAGASSVGVPQVWAFATTDEEGYYLIDELPAGTYFVSAASEEGWEYVQRWYADATSPDQATEVVLGPGEERGNIDIVLPVRTATASIAGTVMDGDGNPLAWAFVQAGPAEAVLSESSPDTRRLWAYGQADEHGAYRVERLPAGTYTVQASYSDGERYGHGWYDGAQTAEAATPVALAEGEARGGVDLRLQVRPMYGVVAGTVTDGSSGAPMARAYVELSPVFRDAARSAPLGYVATGALTDATGAFRMEWIPEGAYILTVYANGATGRYADGEMDGPFGAFEVRGGETAVCDVALDVRLPGEGSISGTVTIAPFSGPLLEGAGVGDPAIPADDSHSGAIVPPEAWTQPEIAVVRALPVAAAEGEGGDGEAYTAVTDPDGAYVLSGLPPGEYLVLCFAPGHIGLYYDGAYAPERAETVRVDGAGEVAGIDFALDPVYRYLVLGEDAERDASGAALPSAAAGSPSIRGNVADASGEPVKDATVYLLDAEERPVAYARTGDDGNYEVAGLPPGEYRVYASRAGFEGRYNGNEPTFAAAEPLLLAGGEAQVDLVLTGQRSTAVVEEEGGEAAVPRTLVLERNYPNPFNPQTRIAFSVPATGPATLRVHNALGQRVATLFDEVAEAGRRYQVVFAASGLGGGTYFCVLQFEGQRLARPMTLAK